MRDAPPALPLLRVEDVTKQFGGVKVLRGVTLALAPGESLGLAGPNGSGKTTLVDVISGFLRPDAGRIWFQGEDLTCWPPHRVVRAGIARTFQVPRLAFHMSVDENIRAATLYRRLRREAEGEVVGHVLETVGLASLRAHGVRTLSPGQVRRVELARALAANPRVLLLDEPFASLGPGDIPEIISVLRQLRASGISILVAGSGRALFRVLCDGVALLQDGRIARTIGSGSLSDA